MIKLDAIKWLIEHVTKWPTYEHGLVSAPDGWWWCKTMLGMELVKDEPTEMYADMHIVQQEWLDGTDDTETINIDEPMSRSDAFDWVYDNYGLALNEWPNSNHPNLQCIERPGGWSWGNIQHKGKNVNVYAELVPPPQLNCENITFNQINTYMTHEQIDLAPTDGATKFDDDKPMMHLVPLISVEAVAKVMTFGAKKYAPNGWKSVPNAVDRYNSAMLRHMVAIQKGEIIDPDSGLPHIDHIACNAMFLSYFHNNGNQS